MPDRGLPAQSNAAPHSRHSVIIGKVASQTFASATAAISGSNNPLKGLSRR